MKIKERQVKLRASCCRCGQSVSYVTTTYEQYDDDGNLVRMWDKLPARDTSFKCLKCCNKEWSDILERNK